MERKQGEIDVQRWTGTEKNEQINRDRQCVRGAQCTQHVRNLQNVGEGFSLGLHGLKLARFSCCSLFQIFPKKQPNKKTISLACFGGNGMTKKKLKFVSSYPKNPQRKLF